MKLWTSVLILWIGLVLCQAKLEDEKWMKNGIDKKSSGQDKELSISEGSGDDENDDEIDDEEYSYYDYGEEDEDYEEGSGDDDDDDDYLETLDDEDLLKLEKDVAKKVHQSEDKSNNDIVFEEEHNNDVDKKNYDDILSEYYDEYYEPDYDEVEKKVEEKVQIQTGDMPVPLEEEESYFELSYLYILLASAFVSFAVFLGLFLICKRGFADQRAKSKAKHVVPFVVSDIRGGHPAKPGNLYSTPIVRTYHRVPTSEKMTALNMNYNENEKPLL